MILTRDLGFRSYRELEHYMSYTEFQEWMAFYKWEADQKK